MISLISENSRRNISNVSLVQQKRMSWPSSSSLRLAIALALVCTAALSLAASLAHAAAAHQKKQKAERPLDPGELPGREDLERLRPAFAQPQQQLDARALDFYTIAEVAQWRHMRCHACQAALRSGFLQDVVDGGCARAVTPPSGAAQLASGGGGAGAAGEADEADDDEDEEVAGGRRRDELQRLCTNVAGRFGLLCETDLANGCPALAEQVAARVAADASAALSVTSDAAQYDQYQMCVAMNMCRRIG